MKMENWSKSKTLNSTCAVVKILNPTCSIWIPSAAKTVRWNSDFGLQSKLNIFQNIDISTIGHYQLLSEMVKCYRDKHLHQSWDVFLELGHSHCHCSSEIFMRCRDSGHKKNQENVIFEGWKSYSHLMRSASETHAAHLLGPVPPDAPWVSVFEGSAEDRVDDTCELWVNWYQKEKLARSLKGGRYWVRQGSGSERQLNWQSLQRATAEFIFTIFCPKPYVCNFNDPLPNTLYNWIPHTHTCVW